MKTPFHMLAGLVLAASLPASADDALVRDSLAIARPQAPVPEVRYRSAFAAYPYGSEPKVGAWRERNELVRRLGGWSAFAKGEVPDDGEPAQPEAAKPPAPGRDHGSHRPR